MQKEGWGHPGNHWVGGCHTSCCRVPGGREALAHGRGALPLSEALCVGWQLPTQGVPAVLGRKRMVHRIGLPYWSQDPWITGHLGANSIGGNDICLGWLIGRMRSNCWLWKGRTRNITLYMKYKVSFRVRPWSSKQSLSSAVGLWSFVVWDHSTRVLPAGQSLDSGRLLCAGLIKICLMLSTYGVGCGASQANSGLSSALTCLHTLLKKTPSCCLFANI